MNEALPHPKLAADVANAVISRDDDVFAANFAFGMAVAAAVVYVKWRGPAGFSLAILYGFLGLGALLWFGPIVVRPFRWSGSSYSIRLLGILVLVLGLGWLAGYFPAVSRLRWVLATAGWLAVLGVTARTAYANWRTSLLSLVFLGIGAAFGCWTTLMCYGNNGYLSPLTVEVLERGTLPHVDTLFMASTSNMIRYYGVLSTGLQGTPYVAYHGAVIAFFAWVSSLLNLGTIASFVLGMPVLVIPLCYGAMLRCALALQRLVGDSRALSALIAAWLIAVCTVGLFSAATDAAIAVWHAEMLSQTYAFSLFVLFSATEVMLWLTWGRTTAPGTRRPLLESLGLALVGFVSVAAAAFSKVSVGALLMCALGFLWLRGRREMSLPRPIVTGALLGFLAISGLLRQNQNSPIELAHFFLSYVKTDWLTYVLLGHLWPIAACLALFFLAKRRPDQARQFDAITEFLLFFVVVATIPGLLLNLPSSAAYYFSNVSVVVGLAALAAFSPLLLERVPSGREWLAPLPAAAALALFFGWSVTMGASINALSVYRAAVPRRAALVGLLGQSGGITPMMALLAKLGDLPIPDRRLTLVDIPLAREDYWKATDCSVAPFVMPAVSGFAFLDGRPDIRCEAAKNYGYAIYPARNTAIEDANAPLCGRRPDQRFRYIVTLPPGNPDWKVLDCQAR